MTKRLWVRKISIILFWLAVWQAAAMAVDNNIILAGPWDAVRALSVRLFQADFWQTILNSFVRITAGFLFSFCLALLLGSLAYCLPLLREFLEPMISLMKSVPVASFIILALIWVGSENLAVLVSFLIVFPVLYVNIIGGLESTDVRLLEMARVFCIPLWKKIRYIYGPALNPYLVSGCRITIGMSWKSGIAAEVIGVPAFSVGEQLYLSKIYLDTAGLLAWTSVIILISVGFEKLFLTALGRLK